MSNTRYIAPLSLLLAVVLLLPASFLPAAVRGAPGAESAAESVSLAAARQPTYGQFPLLFIENRGQTDPQVAFTILGGPNTVFFTPSGVTYALVEPLPEGDRMLPDRHTPEGLAVAAANPAQQQRWAVKLDFVGANPDVRPVGQDPAETVVSYFRGRPDEWHTGLRTYRRIVYPDLWPGIDLAYGGVDGALKYEFTVHPAPTPARSAWPTAGLNAWSSTTPARSK